MGKVSGWQPDVETMIFWTQCMSMFLLLNKRDWILCSQQATHAFSNDITISPVSIVLVCVVGFFTDTDEVDVSFLSTVVEASVAYEELSARSHSQSAGIFINW